ncbi:MAG: D-alanine--D-alanine ligase [Planctomycetota bacterium]
MKIAVLMGGPSLERSISLLTGAEVLRDLVARGRRAFPVVLDAGAELRVGRTPADEVELERLLRAPELPDDSPFLLSRGSLLEGTRLLADLGTDVVFVALHGSPGEDGSLQAWLEWAGLPHTSSGPRASLLALDKVAFKSLADHAGIPTPEWTLLTADEVRRDAAAAARRAAARTGYPAVVKACDQGSSYGVHMVRDAAEAEAALVSCAAMAPLALQEAFVAGTELTCAVLGTADEETPEAWPVVEIVPRRESWFDFESKYADGGADEIVPARIPADVAREMQELAVRVHRLLGCHGISRTDAILGPEGLRVLETNTIPGLTRASLAPKAAAAAGIGFSGLIDRLIAGALHRGRPWHRDEGERAAHA